MNLAEAIYHHSLHLLEPAAGSPNMRFDALPRRKKKAEICDHVSARLLYSEPFLAHFLLLISQERIPMLQDQIIEEIKHIPDNKLAEVYNLIHNFRLGLNYETEKQFPLKERPIGLAKGQFKVTEKFFDPLPDDLLDAFKGRR